MNYQEWVRLQNIKPTNPKRPIIYYLTWVLIAGTITLDLRLLQYGLMWQVIGAVIFGCIFALTILFMKWTTTSK